MFHLVTHMDLYALGRTPLDEARGLYLYNTNFHKRHTSMLPAGLEPAIPACEWPKNCYECHTDAARYKRCIPTVLFQTGGDSSSVF